MKGKPTRHCLDGDERSVDWRCGDEFGRIQRAYRRAVLHDDGHVARIVRVFGLVAASGR